MRIGLDVRDLGHFGKRRLVGRDEIERGKFDRPLARRAFAGPQAIGDATHVAQVAHRASGRQAVSDVDNCPLAHAVDQQVGFAVQQNRTADFIAPIIVVGDTPQARLDAAGDDRHAFVGFTRSLAVGQRRSIRTKADSPARAVSVVVAHLAIGGIVVDHRVHVSRTDGEKQSRPAERAPRVTGVPVGLAENGHAKAFTLQQPAEQCHRETRMIDVSVAGDKHHIDRIPAAIVHLLARHRQRRRETPRAGPLTGVGFAGSTADGGDAWPVDDG